MLDEYRPLRARGRRLEAKAGVTRGLRGVDLARDRQRKRAKAGEQIGRHRGGPDRLAYRCDQRSLAFGCRLENRGGRKRHRPAAKRDRHRLRLPTTLRPVTDVAREKPAVVALRRGGKPPGGRTETRPG